MRYVTRQWIKISNQDHLSRIKLYKQTNEMNKLYRQGKEGAKYLITILIRKFKIIWANIWICWPKSTIKRKIFYHNDWSENLKVYEKKIWNYQTPTGKGANI